MELKSALDQLGLLQKKLYAYQTASSSLYLDSVTVAPKDTSEGRGVALGILAGESQKLMTAPKQENYWRFWRIRRRICLLWSRDRWKN